MDGLKPCPFCGTKDVNILAERNNLNQKKLYIYCHGCDIKIDFGFTALQADCSEEEYKQRGEWIIERWNRRDDRS